MLYIAQHVYPAAARHIDIQHQHSIGDFPNWLSTSSPLPASQKSAVGKRISQDLSQAAAHNCVVIRYQDVHDLAPLGAWNVDGNANCDRRPVAWRTGYLHVAAAELRSFFHAKESQRAQRVRTSGFIEADSVVLHYQEDVLILLDKGTRTDFACA